MDADAALERLREGIQAVRKFGHPRILDAVTIEGVGTCSDALNRGAADLAREYDSLFVLHKSTSQAEVELELRVFGERPVAHMDSIGALHDRVLLNHMTSLDERDVEAVISSGARISQNPTSALKLAKGTTQTGKWKELAAAGVPMALGTDAENVSNHTDICRAMQLAALLPRDATRDPNAISAEQALEMATLGGATALRMQDQVGSLEPGKQADIVVFDTDNFDLRPLHNPVANIVYGSTGHSVDTVLIGGDIVLRHKQLTSLDEQSSAAASRPSTAASSAKSESPPSPVAHPLTHPPAGPAARTDRSRPPASCDPPASCAPPARCYPESMGPPGSLFSCPMCHRLRSGRGLS